MHKRNRIQSWVLCAVAAPALLIAGQGAVLAPGQTGTAAKAQPAAAAPLTDQELTATQDQLIQLLRTSPTLTSVVARDPSLLADEAYVNRNNPQLGQFLAQHPEIVRNPEYYLFTHLESRGGRRDQALERAVWPDLGQPQREQSGMPEVLDKLVPMVVIACFFTALVWIIRLTVESRRWERASKLQSEVHARLIDKFSTSQELAAYMETEAGKRFLEAAPISMGTETGQRMPNVVARVLTPLQIGIVMALLGTGLLLLRHAGPDMDEPMLVLGTVVLMPGLGFILSAGITWVLAGRLGLMPENPSAANSFEPPARPRDRQ